MLSGDAAAVAATAALPGAPRAAYLASGHAEAALLGELERCGVRVSARLGGLLLSPDPPVPAHWALDRWDAPELLPVSSIADAARVLRDRGRNWSHHPFAHHRRSALIAERLPPVKAAPLRFPAPAPTAPLGGWTLLAPDALLLSAVRTSPFVGGQARFHENREGPPSRAYLKLWEACCRLRRWPVPGERCLDLGASPGGWSWALASLGAAVEAIDRSPLAQQVASFPNLRFAAGDAFAHPPDPARPVDWLFSDVIAYPARLLDLVRRWIDVGGARRIVLTVKFQHPTDHDAADAFAAIPGGRLLHLWHNKHELTFAWAAPDVPFPV